MKSAPDIYTSGTNWPAISLILPNTDPCSIREACLGFQGIVSPKTGKRLALPAPLIAWLRKVPRDGNVSDKLRTLAERHKDLDADRLGALERLSQVESHSDNIEDLIAHSSMTIEECRDANLALLDLMKLVDGDHLKDLRKYCKPNP